jgi:hypothetical protein
MWRKVLLAILYALLASGIGVWWVLLSHICEEPAVRDLGSGHVVPYNCHGHTVFITTVQQGVLQWLIPALFAVVFLVQVLRRKGKPNEGAGA